jgi:hypothetical protein
MREDAERVKWLQDRLRTEGVAVWRDRSNLWPGQDWKIEIRRAITGGLAFIACFSEHTQRRDVSFFWEELNWAVEEVRKRQPGKVWLLPVRFADCELPSFDIGFNRTLDSLQWTNLFGRRRDRDAAFAQLLVAVRTIQTVPEPEPAMAPPPRQPSASTSSAFSDRDLYGTWDKTPKPEAPRPADSASRPKANNQPQSPFSLSDLDLGSLFGTSPKRGRDLTTEISISAVDALFGADRSVRLKAEGPCSRCKGIGSSCWVCSGRGRVPSSRTFKVRIPQGVKEGQLIRVIGKGSPGQGGGSPGDLHLQVHIKAA